MVGERRKGKNERMVERRNSVAKNMGIEERNNYGTRQLKAGSGKNVLWYTRGHTEDEMQDERAQKKR